MIGIDAIIVMPLLFLLTIGVAYALLALYSGISISAHTCGRCGQTMPSDGAFRLHMAGHRTNVVRLAPLHRTEKVSKAA